MRRSSSLNLALVWAGTASVLTGLAAVPFLANSHQQTSATVAAANTHQVVAPPATSPTATFKAGTPAATKSAAVRRPSSTPLATRSAAAAPRDNAPAATPSETNPTTAPPSPPKPTPKPAAPTPPASGNYIAIGSWTKPIVVAIGSQAAINACGPASVWYGTLPSSGSGITWLAGHNYCGFAFWDTLSIGTTVTIHDSAGTFTYKIVSRTRLDHQGGTAVGILHDDLILQTCTAAGTSLTYADLISSTP